MTLRDRILARADLNDARAARDITALAAALNAEGLTAPKTRFVTARTVLSECADGGAILDALKAAAAGNSAVDWALKFMSQDSGIDAGNAMTRGMVDQLVAATALTPAQGEALKALANAPVIVTQEQVADALYNPDGTEK